MAKDQRFILELKNIQKSFGSLKALDDVSLDLQFGEVLGLVGDNAAGKSTLMKILSGFYQADKGSIFVEGKQVHIDLPKVSKRLGIEMVYQNLELCSNMSVAENLFLGREILREPFFKFINGKEMESKTRKRVDKLSGGQQQAVAISKAVSFNPKMIILDEPTANLAVKEIGKVLDIITRLKEHGIPAILISHRLEDIFQVCDRIFVLRGGRRVAVHNTNETNRDEIIRHMFL